MDSSSPVDRAFDAIIDVLVHEFDSSRRDTKSVSSLTNADEFVVHAQRRFVSNLRNKLAEIDRDEKVDEAVGERLAETIDTSVVDAPDDATGKFDQEPPTDSQQLEPTIDLTPSPHKTTVRSKSGPKTGEPEADAPVQYEVLGTLGKGGMGIVYKARHVPLDRIVAIKMILAGKHASANAVARFRQEAEAAAHLSHPNIVSVYEVGESQGMPYFSLEFVDGPSLSSLLSKASLTSKRSAELMEQVSRAVHYSHQQGVVHRDLKPANILMTEDGVPKVADFGLAKRLDSEDEDQTKTGQILGTPGFMAPEQARGEKSIGPSADVYALGAILYNMLTGRAPFVCPTPIETIQQVVAEDPVAPSRLQPNLDRDLETICLKCLEKDPAARYSSAADLADELQRVREGKPIVARPITNSERLVKWCRRNPRVATLSGIAAGLLLVLLFGGYAAAGVINQQKIAETDARELAEEAQGRAETNEGIAKEQEALAEAQADLAVDATRLVLYETQKYFESRPDLSELRENMLNGILTDIERVYASHQDYDVQETFRATTLRQLGQIYFEAGQFKKALELFLESESIAIKLHQEGRLSHPELNFGTLDLWIGDTELKLENLAVAEQRYLSMIEHREKYFAAEPRIGATGVQQSMAEAHGRLGEVYRLQGKFEQAKPLLQAAVDARREWYEASPRDLRSGEKLSGALRDLSRLYEATGDFPEMISAAEQAVTLLRRSAANKSGLPSLYNLANGLKQLGEQYPLAGDREKAESSLRESIDQYDAALKESPGFQNAVVRVADCYYFLMQLLSAAGKDYFDAGKFEKAHEVFSESESITIDLHQEGRLSRPELNFETLDLWIGDTELRLGNLDVAEQRYLSMIDHRKKYLAAQPEISSTMAEQSMAEANGRLGEVFRRQGRVEEAKPLLQTSLDTRREWYEANPSDPRTGEELSGALGVLSKLYEDSGQFQEMLLASEQALELLRRSVANKSDFPTPHNLAAALRRLGRQYELVDNREKAESHLRESITQYELALKKSPDYGLTQDQAADSYYMLARMLFRSGRDHSPQLRRGIELCDQLRAKSDFVGYRVSNLKLVALSGKVEEANKLADELVGEHTRPYNRLCGAVGYALAADHCDHSQRQALLDKALDCVRDALKSGFDGFVILRTDPDFELLQKLDEYQQLLDAAESK